MSVAVMRTEQQDYHRRSRVSMVASLTVHALLMLWIVFAPGGPEYLEPLTEITLVEPGEPGGAAASTPAPAAAAGARAGVAVSHRTDESFRRRDAAEDLTPEPQSATAFADRITARLAALNERAPTPVAGVSSSALADGWSPSAATPGTMGGTGAGLALRRGGARGASGPALALHRGSASGPAAAIVATGLPATGAGAAPARGGETTARRVAAGAMLAGPIADRPVVAYTRPLYPEWAKRDAVEGSVTLYFIVQPDGAVRENVLVQKTAGFEDFDENARAALRAWRFAPLRGGRTGDQWGTITFHYRLQEAG